MASGGGVEDAPAEDWGLPLDIDNVHMLLQVEQEQIQKRTFTNWINAQLSKRSPPSAVSDLFSDLRDGARLLDLLEVMSGQPMKRERGHGVFQQRGDIESALNFLKRKSVKLVNINIPDIIDGRPSIVLGLIWTIILHCHIEELASTLSFSSRHSSLDSLASLDSRSNSPALGSPTPSSPTPRGRVSPLHARFRVSAKKALLMWVRDQCQRANCPLSVKDFKSSWRSGVAFLAILCSIRPELVDLELVDLARAQTRSNLQNLEEAFRLAEQQLRIPRLLEPEDVDVENPDDKSIMTYVAQFLQYSNDCPVPDDDLQLFTVALPSCLSPVNLPSHFTPAIAVSPLYQASPNQRAREVTSWLQRAYQELLELWAATEKESYADRHQAFQGFVSSFSEQRRPVVPLLGAMRRCPEPSQEQRALRAAWDRLEDKLRQWKAELDTYLPAPLDSVGVWLQRVEAVLMEEGGAAHDHAHAAREARAKQEKLKTSIQEMSHHLNTLHMFRNADSARHGVLVPVEKLEEIKRRFTNARVTAKYHGIKLEYQERRHTVLDLLEQINAKLRSWKGSYTSHEALQQLLQDWHETVDRQGLVSHLTDALLEMQQTATAYTSKAALGEDSQLVGRQVKEAESETASTAEAVAAVRGSMERALAAWEAYSRRLPSLQAWLAQEAQSHPEPAGTEGRTQRMSEWSGRQAHLNEVGNFLIEVTDSTTSRAVSEQLSRINMQWADYVKRTMFEACSQPSVGPRSAQVVQALAQEAGWLLREPLEVASGPLKAYRKRLQPLSKKIMEVDLSSLGPSAECPEGAVEELRHTLPELWQTLAKAERTCAELQRATSMLEGRVAELVHWGTEASEGYLHLRERERRGHPSLEPRAKVLISRGLQLQGQVVTEAQDLQSKVTWAQRSSPLQYLSGVTMQDRVTEAVAHSQEIVDMLSSLTSRPPLESVTDQPPAKVVVRSPTQTESQNGVSGVGAVRSGQHSQSGPASQAFPPTQPPSSQSPPGTMTGPRRPPPDDTFDRGTATLNTSVKTPVEPQAQCRPGQTQAEPTAQHLSHLPSLTKSHGQPLPLSQSQQQTLSQNKHLPQTTTGPNTQVQTSSPTLPKIRLNPFMRTSESFSTSLAQPQAETPPEQTPKVRVRSSQAAPHPPVMISSEVHSKAQAMAKSRLEKAKFVLQEHIQQAIILFSDREISEWQAKRKQRALGTLRPAVVEEFLGAVEGLGAFYCGLQLRDLELLSRSVRSQWEDVRSQMAAFLPLLWCEIRGGPPLNPVIMGCEMHANRDASHPEHVSIQQACIPTEGEERVEGLRGLCETLSPGSGPHTATAQLRESGGRLHSGPQPQQRHAGSGTPAPPQDSRGRELGGHTPLRKPGPQAAAQQPSQDRPQPQTRALLGTQQRLELPLQAGSSPAPEHPRQAQNRSLKDSQWRALERSGQTQNRPVKVQSHLVLSQTSSPGGPSHPQAIVRGDTVQSQQAPERTVIQFAPPPQEEGSSDQEVRERYQTSRWAFQSQLQRNRQSLEAAFLPETVTVPVLRGLIRELQALKQDTEVLWFEFELQHSQHTQFFQSSRSLQEGGEAERDKAPLTQQWRGQQICLQTRMASLDTTVDLMESADSEITLISDELDRITSKPVDICGFTVTDPTTVADIEEIDQRIQSALRSVSGQSSVEEGEGPNPTTPPPLCHALRNCGHRLNQLRQRLKRVQLAVGALERLLAPLREADSGISSLRAPPDSQEQGEVQGARARLTSVQPRVLKAEHEARGVDSLLNAAGMTLTKDGVVVTCQEAVASVSQRLEEEADGDTSGSEQGRGTDGGSVVQKGGGHKPKEEHASQRRKAPEQGDEPEARRRRGQGEAGESNAPRGKEPEKRAGEEKKPPVQRRMALVRMLREVQAAVDQQGLKEPTLPAVQHRMRALTDLERRLDTQHSELRGLRAAYADSTQPGAAMEELESLWGETHQAVADRLDECRCLTELLKSFQSVRSVVSGALQRAERTISQQASYLGKDNLQRLLTKVDAAKEELCGLGDGVEEIRSVCRQLQAQLRKVPDCADAAFESEADTLMDRWLDVTERTDSHHDSLRVGLALWEGLVQLGGEVESWTNNKMAAFAQSQPFQSDEEVAALQEELQVQEENLERFHRRASEIQALLQSEEPPLELQVIETQTRKKMEQVKEFFSETLDIYRQLVAAKGLVSAKMAECQSSVQTIQDSLDNLSASDASELYAQIQELSAQLQTQAHQADGFMEELGLMASVTSPESLQDLAARCMQLQESVGAARRLVAAKCEQAEEDMERLVSLQKECERLETWLKAAELKAERAKDVTSLQKEVLQNSEQTEALGELIQFLRGSTLKESSILQHSGRLLEHFHRLQTNALLSEEDQRPLASETRAFQTLAENTEAWVTALQQQADSVVTDGSGSQDQAEQRVLAIQAILNVTTEGESRMEDLRLTGHQLLERCGVNEDQKLELLQTIRSIEELWRSTQQPAEQHHSLLQAEPDLSFYLAQRQQARCRVMELQHQTDQLPLLFPWPGAALRRQTSLRAQELLDRTKALGPDFSTLKAQRQKLEQLTEDPIWEDSSWAALEDRQPRLLGELRGLCAILQEGVCREERCGRLLRDGPRTLGSLQERRSHFKEQPRHSSEPKADPATLEALRLELRSAEKDLVELVSLQGFLASSCTVEGQVSLSQQVQDLHDRTEALGRTLESDIMEIWAQLEEKTSQCERQQVDDETFSLQGALQGLSERLARQPDISVGVFDVSQFEQRWHSLQDCEQSLIQLEARLHDLQTTGRSNVQDEKLSSNRILVVDALAKNLDSLRSSVRDKQQQAAADTARHVRETTSRLQQWSQTAQSQPPHSTQVTLDAGRQLHQDLQGALSRREFLQSCLGKKRTKKLEKSASETLRHSEALLTSLTEASGGGDSAEIPLCDRGVCQPGPFKTDTDEESTSNMPDVIQTVETQPDMAEPRKVATIILDTCLDYVDRGLGDVVDTVSHFTSFSEQSPETPGFGGTEEREDGRSEAATHLYSVCVEPDTQEAEQGNSDTYTKPIRDPQSETKPQHQKETKKVFTIVLNINQPQSEFQCSHGQLSSGGSGSHQWSSQDSESFDVQGHSSVQEAAEGQTEKPTSSASGERKCTESQGIECDDRRKSAESALLEPQMTEFKYTKRKGPRPTEDQPKGGPMKDRSSMSLWGSASADIETTQQEQEGGRAEESLPVRAQRSSARAGTAEAGGGIVQLESPRHTSAMQGILSEIRGLVERSDITKGGHRMDPAWYLAPSPREAETRLGRTVLSALGCRYQPAQLNPTAMTQQLKEAEGFRRSVLEQVAAMSRASAEARDPEDARSTEGQCSAALLDAAATLQVKEAQLDLVTQYHEQTGVVGGRLKGLASELAGLTLEALGSNALQVERLGSLLLTLRQQKAALSELLQLCGQVSGHLTESEGSGALLAHLGELQETWKLVEATCTRTLWHGLVSTSQADDLLREAEGLRAALQAASRSFQTRQDSPRAFERILMVADLDVFNQQYTHLLCVSGELGEFGLGQKEREAMSEVFQGLKQLLDLTQSELRAQSPEIVSDSLSKIIQRTRDRVVWAKRTQNLLTSGKRLAVFPEEARAQIAGMRKLQTEIASVRSKVGSETGDGIALDWNLGEEEMEEGSNSRKTLEELCAGVANDCTHTLKEMEKTLRGREKLFAQITKMDTWLVASHIEKETSTDVSPASIPDLERKVRSHQSALKDVERQMSFTDSLLEKTKEMAPGMTPAESRYLVNRLAGLRLELDGMLVHERTTVWELEELLHAQMSSAEELAAVRTSLSQIAADLGRQSFPVTRANLWATEPSRRLLLEHQCHIQELQHCQKGQKGALLCTIAELQEKIKNLEAHAPEHEKYLCLRKHVEDSSVDVGERFRLCQTLLVELPLLKKECQEAADQLEAISQDLYPSQLTSERHKIRRAVENLLSCELTITNDIKMLEGNLLEGLLFCSEYKAMMELLHQSCQEFKEAGPVAPDESVIDLELQGCWVTWRNLESGMRVLEALGQRERVDMRTFDELFTLREAIMQECRARMENLSQAREALKDYHWAAQGAVAFLHNAETTFLSPSGGFLDCTEELTHAQQALASFQEGIEAHVSHLLDVVPQRASHVLAFPPTELLHARVLSHVLVGRATLEAQAQLRLEALKRCADTQQLHGKCHGEVWQLLTTSETRLSECAALDVTSLSKCVQQQNKAEALAEEVRGLAARLKELKAGCPAQGCSAGTEGALGALWRRWWLLQHGVSLLQAHAEQKKEEWRDIGISIDQCSKTLSRLQANLPDGSTVSSTPGDPRDLLAQAEEHQTGLKEAQGALASLEHSLALLLGVSIPQEASILVPVCQTLVKMQDSCRSLTEKSLLARKAAQSEVQERQRWQEKIRDVEQQMDTLLIILDTLPSGRQQQEGRLTLASQKAKLRSIMEGVRARYTEVPMEISNQIQEVTCTLQEMEQKFTLTLERSNSLQRLTHKIGEVGVGLEGIQTLLSQRSSTFPEAEKTLKRVWDELDAWHSRLTALEVEVQDLSEEQPEQAHVLMDQLIQPLQLYQDTAQQAEQRTAFLSRVPACFQEYEDMLHSATCWLAEAQSWLGSTCTYTTAKNLQSHANTLQMVLDDSERIRATLDGFRPSLRDISAVCHTDALEERLAQKDLQVNAMQRRVILPLDQLLHVSAEMESIEAELKAMEKNVSKIRAILSSVDSPEVSLEEHLRNRQVILANIQSMRRTVEVMESCKAQLGLPPGAEETLAAFPRARQLLQPLQELELLTRRQTALLESQSGEDKRAEEVHVEDGCVTTEASVWIENTQVDEAQRGATRSQDAFGLCPFEEEEEEEEEEGSLELSSSDTLTSSLPEDPDETLGHDQAETTTTQNHLDLHMQKPQPPSVPKNSESSETYSKAVPKRDSSDAPEFCQVTAGPAQSNTLSSRTPSELVGNNTTSRADLTEAVTKETTSITRPEKTGSVTVEAQSVPETGLVTKATASRPKTGQAARPTCDTVTHAVQTRAPACREEAQVVPARPAPPFSPHLAHVDESHETPRHDHPHLGSPSEQGDVESMTETHSSLADQAHHTTTLTQSSPDAVSRCAEEEEGTGRWARLHSQLSDKLGILRKIQEENEAVVSSKDALAEEKDPGLKTEEGIDFVALQELQKCVATLQQLRHGVRGTAAGGGSGGDSDPVQDGELYSSLSEVVLSVDALTDQLLRPPGTTAEQAQLRALLLECVSTELVVLGEELTAASSHVSPALSDEDPGELESLNVLDGCLQTAQSVLFCSQDRLRTRLGRPHENQAGPEEQEGPLCLFEELTHVHGHPATHVQDAPRLECMLISQWRKWPEDTTDTQRVSHALLQGLASLVELGQERVAHSQDCPPDSRSQLQSLVCRHKKFFYILGSRLAFGQRLFQDGSQGALRDLEEEWLELERRAQSLQQQALEQRVTLQKRLQDWSQWEVGCERVGRLLEELEALIPGENPEEEEMENQLQDRLEACQRVLDLLLESRPTLGWILDVGKVLQAGGCSTRLGRIGGALELRWRGVRSRAQLESKRSRDLQENWARFQKDSVAFTEWTQGAHQRLESLRSGLAEAAPAEKELNPGQLIHLLDFSMELEARSAQRASALRAGASVLQLKEADSPILRRSLAQLEQSWTGVSSTLPAAQEKLHQLLLDRWPPKEVLVDLETWASQVEVRLEEEREGALKACHGDQFTQILQRYQELKAGLASGQLTLDFLCQSGPQAALTAAERSERTLFAERLGDVNLRWLLLQREMEIQMREAERLLHACVDRETKLRRIRSWVELHLQRLGEWLRPVSQIQAGKALAELEPIEERVKELFVALKDLRAVRVSDDLEHPSDQAFSQQAGIADQASSTLSQQVQSLKPALQHVLEEWGRFEQKLSEVSFLATRVRCTLEHSRAPLLSSNQVKVNGELLQMIQEDAGKGVKVLAAVDQSYSSLRILVSPDTAQLLSEKVEGERTRWKAVVQEVEKELQRTRELHHHWQEYSRLSDPCVTSLRQHQEQWGELVNSPPKPQEAQDRCREEQIVSIKNLQGDIETLQPNIGEVLEASKMLIGQLDPLAASLIQSETRLLSRDLLLLSQMLLGKQRRLQEDLDQQRMLGNNLEALEKGTEGSMQRLTTDVCDIDSVKMALCELSNLLPKLADISAIGCRASANEREAERVQSLASRWKHALLLASAKRREIEDGVKGSERVQQKLHACESFLDELEEALAGDTAKNYSGLLDMLAVHQRRQVEIAHQHHIFRGVVYNTASSLDNDLPEERSKLIRGLYQLRERWKGIAGPFGRRGAQVQGLMGQWRLYRRGVRVLWRLMRDVDPRLPPAGLPMCSLRQLRRSLNHFEHIEETLHLHASVREDTFEAGRRLSESMTEPRTQGQLQKQLQALQEAWLHTLGQLGKRRALVHTVLQNWERCQARLADSARTLRELKARLEQPLPERLEELESQDKIIQETEASLEVWTTGMRDIATMKTDLSQHVVAGDASLLQEQVEALHNQWEELCVKVSLRRQEIANRLSAWIIFNDKNKELSDWLAQMENKVSHSGDLGIEDMVEKLKKDCMEEIDLFSQNKSHLKRLGEQLMAAGDQARQAQVQGSLRDAGERWQALFQHIEARVRKLKETLVTVQQLDRNMSNLRSWLARVENDLSTPVTYCVVHQDEIQRRLAEQQELQRDIEQHTEGVASVLTLCDVLLRDEDVCGGSDVESDSVQGTTRSLDQRWRSICALSLERRLRIEETWRLWCKFLDDYSRFDDWLKTAERTAASPKSSGVLYTVAKEELKKFEGFQRQVHERLTQLELVNNQYRRLARENRTDRASKLKVMVHEGNHRWDMLARRVAAILRRLKHFTGQREEFEGTRESMLVWLTELDLQLTNVEHFSESDVHHKMRQLNSFQKDITLNTERIDGLIVSGEGLIQRSAPLDAALIEDELEELHSYCQEVFSRVVRFHQRLTQPPTLIEEPELFDSSLEGSCELVGRPWLGRGLGSTPATPTHLLAPPLERSGRETPASVDSLPLEWDHTGDVGGSSSHEDDEDDREGEGTYFSALSDVEVTESSEVFVQATGQALGPPDSGPGRSTTNPESAAWSSAGDQERKSLYLDAEDILDSSPGLTSTPFKQGYSRLMSECSGSLNSVKRVSLILDDEEQPDEQGLTSLTVADKQSGVIERWELLQAQARSERQQGPRDPPQLTSDLCDITSWLGRVNPELDRLKRSDTSAGIQDLEARVKQLKDMQKDFTRYKAVMLSLNLGTRAQGGPLGGPQGGPLEGRDAQMLQESLGTMNQGWTRACGGLGEWESSLRHTLMRSQEFHETLHSLLLWLAHAESRRYAVDIQYPDTQPRALLDHHNTLTGLQEELRDRQAQVTSLQGLWAELQPEEGGKESDEAREKLHVTANKLRLLLRQVGQDLATLQQRMESEGVCLPRAEGGVGAQGGGSRGSAEGSPQDGQSRRSSTDPRRLEKRDPSPPRSFFYRVLRAAFPLHVLLLLLLVLACLVPFTENDQSCTLANNFARSFYPMLRYTNGPPPT
ncbi:nesprin-2-like isoform X4 [Hypomesus transpacificus]|uniref:nesprin-2-like isoform X4 n=1 Tax=Hypomesus transpacificus TaxID=137520 RepID=UPI001F076ED9|nr:nesprin-2-like isoform X4 [Hypomesus transpacificus]